MTQTAHLLLLLQRAWINVSTTSAQTRIPPIGLPENMLTVYPQPPLDVGVAFVVDGQAVEQEGESLSRSISNRQPERVALVSVPIANPPEELLALCNSLPS